jgi:high-affinity Fe2+/Pb2+ permease
MDRNATTGLTLVGLATAIMLGLLALTLQGQPYMLWADMVFGFVAAGLLFLGFSTAKRSH